MTAFSIFVMGSEPGFRTAKARPCTFLKQSSYRAGSRSQLHPAWLAYWPSENSTISYVRHRAQKIYQSHNGHLTTLSFNANPQTGLKMEGRALRAWRRGSSAFQIRFNFSW